MPWCDHCKKNTPTERGDGDGYLCCKVCGKVIDQDMFSTEVTFFKGAGGQSQMCGNFVNSVENNYSESHERTCNKGKDEISDMVVSLNIGGRDSIIDEAAKFYRIAVDRNFTRGRRTAQVAAACLYIACRENKKPYLLIDFSEYLQINVYVLGAVFLQLCKLLRLEEHPFVQKPVDPSLFIHRFSERLLREKNPDVPKTALRIIASMKRDWMQTGRKPSGLCGAALYISALSHGLKFSKANVVSVVHICEATLTKRLVEFENTESGSLTIEEFEIKAVEYEKQSSLMQEINLATESSKKVELLCEHKGTENPPPHFAHGLCKDCYDDFFVLSGGLQGGSEPPAFQRAEWERMAKAVADSNAEESSLLEKSSEHLSVENQYVSEKEKLGTEPSQCIEAQEGSTAGHKAVEEGASDQPQCDEGMDAVAGVESESLSDIDDDEVDGYLHNEEEKHFKKIIWEEMNKEYIEEQAAKEAAKAAEREANAANFKNCPAGAQELHELTAAYMAKTKKEKQQKRAADAKNAAPAQTAAEATRQMLTKKAQFKINYDVLDKLFDDSTTAEAIKKKRTESDKNDTPAKAEVKGKEEEEPESDLVDNEDYEDDGNGDYYGDDASYYGNEEGGYGNDEDFGYEY